MMKSNVLIRRIQTRINQHNRNWMCIITGATGSGKSYTGMTLAKLIDSTFDINRVVFTSRDFMALLNSGTLHKGDAILFDEAGVGMPSREWYSLSNKMLNYVLETFREQNLCVIFTTPSFDFIDSQARKLFHTFIQTAAINRKEERVITKWFDLQHDPRSGETYFKYPRANREGEGTVMINRVCFAMPPEDLRKAYEIKKSEYAKQLRIEAEKELNHIETEANKKKLSLDDVMAEIRANPTEYTKKIANRTIVSVHTTMAKLGVSEPLVRKAKAILDPELNNTKNK